jgi:hypothetical protein
LDELKHDFDTWEPWLSKKVLAHIQGEQSTTAITKEPPVKNWRQLLQVRNTFWLSIFD